MAAIKAQQESSQESQASPPSHFGVKHWGEVRSRNSEFRMTPNRDAASRASEKQKANRQRTGTGYQQPLPEANPQASATGDRPPLTDAERQRRGAELYPRLLRAVAARKADCSAYYAPSLRHGLQCPDVLRSAAATGETPQRI